MRALVLAPGRRPGRRAGLDQPSRPGRPPSPARRVALAGEHADQPALGHAARSSRPARAACGGPAAGRSRARRRGRPRRAPPGDLAVDALACAARGRGPAGPARGRAGGTRPTTGRTRRRRSARPRSNRSSTRVGHVVGHPALGQRLGQLGPAARLVGQPAQQDLPGHLLRGPPADRPPRGRSGAASAAGAGRRRHRSEVDVGRLGRRPRARRPCAPTPNFSLIFFSSSSARSGLSRRKARAFSLPWPSWSPS